MCLALGFGSHTAAWRGQTWGIRRASVRFLSKKVNLADAEFALDAESVVCRASPSPAKQTAICYEYTFDTYSTRRSIAAGLTINPHLRARGARLGRPEVKSAARCGPRDRHPGLGQPRSPHAERVPRSCMYLQESGRITGDL